MEVVSGAEASLALRHWALRQRDWLTWRETILKTDLFTHSYISVSEGGKKAGFGCLLYYWGA